MTEIRGPFLDKVLENRKLTSECKSLQLMIEKLQKEMTIKDEKIKDIESKLQGKLKEIEQLKLTNKKLLDIVSLEPRSSVRSPANRREGISDQPMGSWDTSEPKLTKHPKDLSSRTFISEALYRNDFLKNLEKVQLNEMVDCMYIREFDMGQFICREGQSGTELYVLAEGEVQVTKCGEFVQVMKPGVAFGELAILYNCSRTATNQALTHTKVWALDRNAFHGIMMKTGIVRQNEQLHFLRSISLFQNFSDGDLLKIADVLQEEYYISGEYIIRQGSSGDTFFIINEGTVKVTYKPTSADAEVTIQELSKGEFFGEKALRGTYIRTASVIAVSNVSCVILDKDHFHQLINPKALDWPARDREEEELEGKEPAAEKPDETLPDTKGKEYASIRLSDLMYEQTLGSGGFGKVMLVTLKSDNTKAFALKCLAKKHIVNTRQEEHVFSEKEVQSQVHCHFVAQVFNTFRCSKYLYILMEVCHGGELWTLLRDLNCFEDTTTRFCTGCVVEAFDYLHSKGIVYRDLKPENLLLDSHGYVKLIHAMSLGRESLFVMMLISNKYSAWPEESWLTSVDFGFAKCIKTSRKTWTFCGTPEYVSPEIILNKGHDCASDYWSLGILIFELLTGTPPFSGGDSMKTYNLILKGIDTVHFPKKVRKNAQNIIKKLCRDNPSERLGNLHAGIKDIKCHRWFEGFDWESLRQRTMRAPLIPNVRGPTDTSNFDTWRPSQEGSTSAEDDLSGWDESFGALQATPKWLL